MGNIYSSVCKDSISEIKLRGFKGVMQQRNISEQVPDKAIETLLETVSENYSLYHRFVKIKAQILKNKSLLGDYQRQDDKIDVEDLNAPITTKETNIEFDKAKSIFLDTLKDFDSSFYDFSTQMFNEGRVDVYPKHGKMGGAFASYEKDFDSFVLLNYTGKLRDVSTIAHELGHATHGFLSQKQTHKVYHSGLCLAETASVFNEMLFFENFVKTLDDKQDKLSFMEARLSDIFATIFTQVMYTRFEKECHETFLAGKSLTYPDFNKLWNKYRKEYYGDQVVINVEADQDSGWSSIPHFFKTPFYCYSYSFGNLLTFSLYQKYIEDNSFVDSYKEVLAAGGSKAPYDLLIKHDLDITSKDFYLGGIKVIQRMLDEFESVL